MPKSSPKRRPGDVILDRYMPDASPEEREAARANLYGFVAVLLRIATREALDNVEKSIRANGEGEVESESLPPAKLASVSPRSLRHLRYKTSKPVAG